MTGWGGDNLEGNGKFDQRKNVVQRSAEKGEKLIGGRVRGDIDLHKMTVEMPESAPNSLAWRRRMAGVMTAGEEGTRIKLNK